MVETDERQPGEWSIMLRLRITVVVMMMMMERERERASEREREREGASPPRSEARASSTLAPRILWL